MMERSQEGVLPHFYYIDYRINWLFAGQDDEVRRVGRINAEGDSSSRVWANLNQTYHNRKFREVSLIEG
jgi:hypothetical protein